MRSDPTLVTIFMSNVRAAFAPMLVPRRENTTWWMSESSMSVGCFDTKKTYFSSRKRSPWTALRLALTDGWPSRLGLRRRCERRSPGSEDSGRETYLWKLPAPMIFFLERARKMPETTS